MKLYEIKKTEIKSSDLKKIQSGIFDLENRLKAIAGDQLTYKDIESIIQTMAKNNSITQTQLESFFKRKHGVQPYEWLAYLPTPRRPKNWKS